MNFIKKNWSKFILMSFVFLFPVISFAQNSSATFPGQSSATFPSDPNSGGMINNPLPNITSIPDLIRKILEGVLKIGIPIVALAIIYCGFLFVFARGNSEKLGKAKEALLYTIIGAAILLGAYAIANIISSTVLSL